MTARERSDVGWITHADCELHFAGPGHPERPERLRAVVECIESSGAADELDRRTTREATHEELASAHAREHVESIESVCRKGRVLLDDGDTYVCPDTFRAASLAAGAALEAVELVQSGIWRRAFVAVRPPGHHAEETHAMGFCLFNNVALAARRLRERLGLERVAIVDWDVHHGNGTQHAFEDDPSVFYASLHQFPHYPGTGHASERGRGAGEGTTLNLPQRAGVGDREWLDEFESKLAPALEEFRPQFVLVSAGFDAHRDDPLSGTLLTDDAYRRMSQVLIEISERHAGGRIVSVLEGGYDLNALASSSLAHVETLLRAPRRSS